MSREVRGGRGALLLASSVLAVCLAACGEEQEPRSEPAPERRSSPEPIGFEPLAGGLAWQAREPLIFRRPSNEMRVAEYVVGGHRETVLTVSHFPQAEGGGGQVQANLGRWIGQITQPDRRPSRDAAQIERREISGIGVTTIDLSGTFVGRQGMSANAPARDDWRLLGAIAEGPRGLVFFKLLGPADSVVIAEDAFMELVDSIHPG